MFGTIYIDGHTEDTAPNGHDRTLFTETPDTLGITINGPEYRCTHCSAPMTTDETDDDPEIITADTPCTTPQGHTPEVVELTWLHGASIHLNPDTDTIRLDLDLGQNGTITMEAGRHSENGRLMLLTPTPRRVASFARLVPIENTPEGTYYVGDAEN